MYAWYELNEKWIKYGIIILKYGVFILFGQTCDEGTSHVGTLWPGYRGVPSTQVLLYFHPIRTCVFHASIILLCRFFFSYCSLHTSTHFLIDWQPGVGILLLHINLCLLVLYLVSKLSCYLTCWVNTSSSWENHTCKSTASSGRVAGA